MILQQNTEITDLRDFPDCPVVKMPPSNAEAADSIPGLETTIPHASCVAKTHKIEAIL